jgi:multidrug efflux pump subunit AcrA (membrane-fusion protein)
MKAKFKGLWSKGWALESKAIQQIFVLSILAAIFQLALPLGIQGLTGFVSGGEFRWGTVSIVLLVLIATVLANKWQVQMIAIGEQMEERLFVMMAYGYAKKAFFKTPESQTAFATKAKYFIEVSGIQKGYSKKLVEVISSLLQLIIGVLLISFYHPFFLAFGFILLLGLFLIIWTKGKKALMANMQLSDNKYQYYQWIQKAHLKNEEGESTELHQADLLSNQYIESKRSYFSLVIFQLKSFLFFKMCIIAVMLLLGVYLAIEQKISLGQFLAAELVILLVVNSIEKLLFSLSAIYETLISFEKGFQLIEDLDMEANAVKDSMQVDQFQTWTAVIATDGKKRMYWSLSAIAILIGVLLLPWTQNIEANGRVVSMEPNQRPQAVQSVIAGRIEKWYVQEGDWVKVGDTLLFLSEVKVDYFDPQLLQNTESQIKSKEGSVSNYMEKVRALDSQIDALLNAKDIKRAQVITKLEQVKLKIKTDSTDLVAVENNARVVGDQMKRFDQMFQQGVISKTDWESRQVSLQNAQAKVNDQKNKLAIARNELINTYREYKGVDAEYRDKVSKAESEKYSTLSAMYDAEAQVTKLQNQYNNYDRRTGFYYLIAPQDGFVSKATKSGIGETVKEGEEVVRITPNRFDQAVEIFIDPVNTPLVHEGENVRLIFDGWPAFVISGWSQMSTGLFDGQIVGIDPVIQDNGQLRIWVKPQMADAWPAQLRQGGGVRAFMLLNDVPLGYELWRLLNAFPPDYYQGKGIKKSEMKKEEKADDASKESNKDTQE